jgi:predicted RNA-binding Zn-ribbon protein involved in translation (DUF1610 family)
MADEKKMTFHMPGASGPGISPEVDTSPIRYTESDIARGREIARINAVSRDECPNCGEPLEHTSGQDGIPAHRYCPRCMDVGYDDEGNQILRYE